MQGYKVNLDLFEGPLDLLLQLIEKRELDITTVSLATVTDQYLEYLDLASPDLDSLADFLIIASKLLVIKSMAMFPQQPITPEQEDIAGDLTRRLIEYRAFKIAAEELRKLEEIGGHCHPRIAPPPQLPPSGLPDGLTMIAILEALQRALTRIQSQPREIALPRQFFSITEKIDLLVKLTSRHQHISLNSLFAQTSCRSEAIALFLGMLELLRTRIIDVDQENLFGDIIVLARPKQNSEDTDRGPEGIDENIGEGRSTVGSEALVEFV